jgi:hypothetical protein
LVVHLHLPSGLHRILRVPPENYEQGLLGSDFSYADLRMLLPLTGRRYRVVGDTTLIGHSVRVLEEYLPPGMVAAESSPLRRRYYVAPDISVLLGMDVFREVAGTVALLQPAKCMRVTRLARVNDVWTASGMEMRAADGRASVLTLLEAELSGLPFSHALFTPDALPDLAGRLRIASGPTRSPQPRPFLEARP